MSALDDLRVKFLGLNASEEKRFDICVDRDLQGAVEVARSAVTRANAELDTAQEAAQERSDEKESAPRAYALAGTPADDDRVVAAQKTVLLAEQALTAAEAAEAERSVSIVFGKLPPEITSAMQKRHTTKDDRGQEAVDYEGFLGELATACYRRAERLSDGEDLDLTWEQIRAGGVTEADVGTIWSGVLSHNREITVHPR